MYIPEELKNEPTDFYFRRSSDDADHQTASIDQQRSVLSDFAKKEGLRAGKIFEESMSAKKPGRPLFTELLTRIETGETKVILCWDLSRLSRNPIDTGRISWFLQNGILKAIITPSRVYLPEDNVLLMSVELSMANQYLRDLSKNVKRGLSDKLNRGWRPGLAPEGYQNNLTDPKGERRVVPDPERFPLVRKMWDLLLTGNYAVPEILRIATNEWHYRTPQHKKLGGGPLSRAALYKLFCNQFYAGSFYFGGKFCQGKHQPMISQAEYDRAQTILGRHGKQRPQIRSFSYTGFIRCGECGAAVTAEFKTNRQGHTYIYYHCTKRKTGTKCTQGYTQIMVIESQIDALLAQIEVPVEFVAWGIKYLNELHDRESTDQLFVNQNVDKEYQNCLTRINNLIKLKINPANIDGSLLADSDYEAQMAELQKEKLTIEAQKKQLGERVNTWIELSEKTFHYCQYSRYWFRNGSVEDKRALYSALGSNFLLKDGILSLDLKKPYEYIKNAKPEMETLMKLFEPEEKGVLTAQKEEIFNSSSTLRWVRDSNSR